MITQSINLNLIPGAVPPRIKVSQYDIGSRTLQFTLFNGTTTFTQAGLSARIQGTKPDGKGFSYDATYGSGIVTADITRQMTACAGAVTCELVIVNEELDEELGTGNFILDVEAAALSEDTDISETEIPAIIDAAEANAERAEAAAESAEAASAHAPYIGENEHWYVWDSDDEQYVDSGVDAKGDDGATIVSVEKTSTSGYIDTYTITMSNGNTSTFTVTNGTSTLPGGGTKGQVLMKKSGTTGDADWSSDLEAGMEGLINSTVGWTGKNELHNSAVSKTENGVTFTVNADGQVVVDTGGNQASNNTSLVMLKAGTPDGEAFRSKLLGKTVIMNGCPSGGGDYTYFIFFYNYDGAGHSMVSKPNPVEFVFSNASETFQVSIVAVKDAVISNALFEPMIRLATVTDPTYEPYHKSVEECKADNTVIAPVESGTTASQAYAQGAHFIRDGKFCTAITSIASGATLTKNTNYTEGDIASALSSGGSSGGEVYPSTETKIGTFLGVDLYRKVYKITSISSSFDTGISNAYYITRITGNITKGEAVYNLPHYASSSDRLSVYLQKGSFSDIYYKANFIQSIQDVSYVILIVEYTKENPYA